MWIKPPKIFIRICDFIWITFYPHWLRLFFSWDTAAGITGPFTEEHCHQVA